MPHSPRPIRQRPAHRPFFDLVARVLVVTLLGQSMPMHGVRPADAGSGPAVRWVDARGGCDGHVPCYSRIQAAIDAVRAGEIVRILPGEYVERLRIQRKNATSRFASDRIVIEADPNSPADRVVLRGTPGRCESGYAVDFDRSRYVTLRGLVIAGAGQRGVGLRGGSRQNVGIRLERNRLLRGSTGACSGGIDVGRGNPDTIIANNLVYANGRDGVRFRDGTGGSYLVYGNTIARNGWNGIAISRAAQARIWNNVVAFNGTAPERIGGRAGIRRNRVQEPRPQDIDLRHNLICGNRLDEIVGPVLDPADVANLTPTGSEGSGVIASPRCALVDELLADPAGADATLDTLDDSFALAPDAPAIDAGLDPRLLLPSIEARLFAADHVAEGARPQDGDGDGEAAFDIGAMERAGARGPTPTARVTATPSPVPTATPTPSVSPTPTATASPTPTPTGSPTPTASPTATPTATPVVTASPAPTIAPTAHPTATAAPTASPVPPTPVPTASPAPTPAATPTPSVAPTASPVPTATQSPRPGNRAPSAAGNRYTVRADQVLQVPAPGILVNDTDPDRDALAAVRLSEPGLGTLSLSGDGGFTFDPDEAQLGCAGISEPTGPVFAEPTTLVATQENSGRGGFGVARGDFDRDGNLDLAVTVFDRVAGVLGNRLLVLLGNGDGTFQPPATLHTATDSEASLLGLVARDLDGDGLIDLLLVDNVRSQLLFFRGDGNGGFASPLASSTAGRSHVVQVADLDGDGILDAVVASLTVTNLTALRGNGDGTFQTPVVLRDATQIGSGRIAVGDVNGDGAPDVVYGDGSRLGTLLNANDGTGTLVAKPTRSIPTARSLYLADFDGDQKLDVAVAVSPCSWQNLEGGGGRRPSPAYGFPACVAMLPGNGDGTFVAPANDHIAGLPLGGDNVYAEPIVADLDGNGTLDVLLPPGHDNREANYVSVGLNTGDGSFRMAHWIASAAGTPPRPITTDVDGFYSNALLAGDFTGDDVPDVVVTGGSIGGLGSTVAVSLVRGIGAGRFFSGQGLTLGPLPYDFGGPALGFSVQFNAVTNLAVGDFDGDGLPEIVSAKGYQPIGLVYNTETIARREIAPDGSIGDPLVASPFLGGDFFYRLKPADFDRDGSLDLAFVQRNASGAPQLVRIAYGDGTGNLAATVDFSYPYSGPWAGNFAVGDFDGDGFPDVALLTTAGGIDVKLNDGGTRTFTAGQSIAGPDGSSASRIGIVAADFDRDGNVDLIANAGTGATAGANQQQSLFYRGHGDGTFAAGVAVSPPLAGGGITDYAVGDLDHDGDLDLLGNSNFGPLWVQLGNGDGTFQTAVSYSSPGTWLEEGSLALADIDRDGHLDVALAGSVSSFASNRGILILPGRGDGTFATPREVPAGVSYGGDPVLADVNQDGLPDLLAGRGERREYAVVMLNAADRRVGCRKTDHFTYRASDGDLGSNTATVTIEILPANHAPLITSVPPTVATEGRAYAYDVEATDPDPGDAIAFALIDGPPGMAIDPDSGVIAWLPRAGQTGTFPVVVRAYDSTGASIDQSFTLAVRSTVTVPDVVGQTRSAAEAAIGTASLVVGTVGSAPSTTVAAGSVISQSPLAGTSVVSGSPVSFVISTGPPGPGETIVSIAVAPAALTLLAGESYAYRATATFADGTGGDITASVAWTSSVSSVATIATGGSASALAAGTTTISATQDGVTGMAALTVAARVPGDVTPPLAEITAPATGTEVTAPIAVIGSATDDAFVRYELALAPAGDDMFEILATGGAPVSNGTLGTLDPTMLLNGLYTLRLRVYDAGGNVTEASSSCIVARERKVGAFTLEFVDLEIALSGIPIRVVRRYDSRDKRQGDFGVGWRLGVETLRLQTNRVLGTGWTTQSSGLAVQLVPLDQHFVTVTLPDGKVETFDLQLSPTSAPFTLDFTNVVGFAPRPGTLGKLEGLDNPSLFVAPAGSEVELWDDDTFDTYNPRRFRYTALDGTSVVIDRIDGVVSSTEPNGNTLQIGAFGITHSSGKSVTFVRDGAGRITQIVDAKGQGQIYTYDARGDLRSHTSAVGNVTRFTYDGNHHLLDIVDPSGARIARNEYDDDGRLIGTVDADGRRVQITHDLATRQEVVKDRLGNVTVLEYDAFGNVVRKTDALGKLTTYTHDAAGNLLTEKDPLGRVASKTWDASRNLLSTTDFDGNTTTMTYDAHGRVLTTTDPDGRTTANVYDAKGNLTQVTDPEGGITQHAYDAAGNRTSTTDPLGKTTTFGRDAFGNLISQTDPLGTVSTYAYDANGDPTSLTVAGRSTQLTNDVGRRPTLVTDALGNTTHTTYAAFGDGKRIASATDTLGRTTSHEYDVYGRRTKTTYPDGSTRLQSYDAEGRITTVTDRDGRTSTLQYDALGRQTGTVNPDGTSTSKTLDAAGRIVTQTDERGNVTTYAYAPNRQVVTDPLGNVTTHDLDAQQRRVATTDALGRVTTFAYDSRGNLVRTTFDDGSQKTATYDLAGHKSSETDQAGRTATFVYDAAGRLTSVTDAAGQVTTYTWDAQGNLVTTVDANGHTTTAQYDILGRVTSRTLPLGQTETFAHDAAGNVVKHTDFNGDVTTFTYDADNRQVSRTLPGGSVITIGYTPEGRRTHAGGDVSVLDARGRILQETKASGDVIAYTYDAAGNRASMTTPQGTTTYVYDALNRLKAFTDATGTTTYAYTAVGNVASTTYPNGVVASYHYDGLHRLTRLDNTGPGGPISSYVYTLGPAGNRVQVVESGPATTGRMVFYTYDAVYRLVEELIDEPGTVNDAQLEYAYDGVGNRTTMTRDGVATSYVYDANDRLISHATGGTTTSYTYDDAGNLASRTIGAVTDVYTYDAESRLVAADVQDGSNPGPVTYGYDADGMRTSVTSNGQTTTYLLDKNREHAQVVLETSPAGTVSYGYGLDLVSQTRPGGATTFHLYDGQLSTRQLTTAAGVVSDTYTYDAFGVMLHSSGTSPNVYLYAGEQLDPNVGFYYLRARYYDHAIGRFTSTDPEEGQIFDPPSLHRYLYAGADPVDNADPSGRFDIANQIGVLGVLNIVVVGVVFVLGLVAGKSVGEAAIASGKILLDIMMWELLFAVGGFVIASAAAPLTLTVGVASTTAEALGVIAAIESIGGGAKALEVLINLNKGVRVSAEFAKPLVDALKGSLIVIRENKAAFCGAKAFVDTIATSKFPAYITGHLVTPAGAQAASKALDFMGYIAGVEC
jgi:RHS repeat-associated protein